MWPPFVGLVTARIHPNLGANLAGATPERRCYDIFAGFSLKALQKEDLSPAEAPLPQSRIILYYSLSYLIVLTYKAI